MRSCLLHAQAVLPLRRKLPLPNWVNTRIGLDTVVIPQAGLEPQFLSRPTRNLLTTSLTKLQ
jgi:hypothetical protein